MIEINKNILQKYNGKTLNRIYEMSNWGNIIFFRFIFTDNSYIDVHGGSTCYENTDPWFEEGII